MHRLAQHHRVGRHDEGAHRQAVDRRRGDDRQVLHPAQRHVQRARDRRRGHGQHVDLGAQLLQLLLVRDAEMLLLVDDDEAQVLERDALAEQRVGADDDVDLPVGQALLDLVRLLRRSRSATAGRPGPAGPRSGSANTRKCWRTRSVVGASSATCLPDMAATKAARSATSVLPKPTSPQISRSIGRPEAMSSSTASIAAQLVLGLLVGEAGGELLVDARAAGRAPCPCRGRALGRDLDQLAGQLADPLLDLGLAASASRRRPACRAATSWSAWP